MSTVRSIERRLYIRRQLDREAATLRAASAQPVQEMTWGGIWAGYAVFAGSAVLLLSLVMGIAFSSFNPLSLASWSSLGSGVAIWGSIALLISVFIGGFVAGRSPATTHQHGLMRGFVLWGLVMLTAVVVGGGLSAGAATGAAAGAANYAAGYMTRGATAGPGAGAGSAATLQSDLRRQGVTISSPQAAEIDARLQAGDQAGAAALLAADAGLSTPRATAIVNGIGTPAGKLGAVGAGPNAARALRTGAKSVAWGAFWLALLTLICAAAGGVFGGGTFKRFQRTQPSTAT